MKKKRAPSIARGCLHRRLAAETPPLRSYPTAFELGRLPAARTVWSAVMGLAGLGALTLGGCMPAVRPTELPPDQATAAPCETGEPEAPPPSGSTPSTRGN